ncbi:MAG: type II toxin-antitoxin system death-on-curing family toxin [Geminicoccaceae bacterium]|nr:type II toxin-antitoxin system death-on-curing family toxin [Geminicoccaceae bacterium]
MIEPAWVALEAVLLLHEESIAEHGGLTGVRDLGLLESALARPRNLFADEGVSDIARLAAAYAAGIARNHPFADGNKRAAFLALGLFVAINGWRLVADKTEATLVMLDLAAGELEEEALAAWIRARLARRSPQP